MILQDDATTQKNERIVELTPISATRPCEKGTAIPLVGVWTVYVAWCPSELRMFLVDSEIGMRMKVRDAPM